MTAGERKFNRGSFKPASKPWVQALRSANFTVGFSLAQAFTPG